MEDRRGEERFGDRRDEILRALVEQHIRSGEPVSSRSVLESSSLDVSAATIRNELAVLEREGFVVQPHTSAGRVPTSAAYRYYVDHLSPGKLQKGTEKRIADFYSTVHLELGRLLKATTDLLSDLTQYPAVAISPGPANERIKAVHLVQMGSRSIMSVLVTESGRVGQELSRLTDEVSAAEIEDAERLLIDTMVGVELGLVSRDRLEGLDVGPSILMIAVAVVEAMHRLSRHTADIYIGGTRQMATVWDSLTTVRGVLEVLEREAMLMEVLARTPGTTIQFGDEVGGGEFTDIAVVSSSFEAGSAEGRLGVVGPLRMDYRRVISAVEGVSRELGDRMGS